MNPLLIGNAIAMIGCLIMVGIGFLKKKNHILIAQSAQCLFMGIGNIFLGGISGFICNMVIVLRNIVFLKFPNTTALKVFFTLLQFLLSISSLRAGWISWMPILATGIFTWCVDIKSEAKLKVILLIAQFLWLAYDVYFHNFAASAFGIMTIISHSICLFTILKKSR